MTDMTLTEAIAEVKRSGILEDERKLLNGLNVQAILTTLQAVASDELIPTSDTQLAIAHAYQRAATHIVTEAARLAEGMQQVDPALAFLKELAAEILALAPADDLAAVESLKRERDEYKAVSATLSVMVAGEQQCKEAAEAEVAALKRERDDTSPAVTSALVRFWKKMAERHQADAEEWARKSAVADDAREAAEAEVARLREALDGVMVGGNHLATWLPENVPDPATPPLVALEMIGAGVSYDVWCCWQAIMRARAALHPATKGDAK